MSRKELGKAGILYPKMRCDEWAHHDLAPLQKKELEQTRQQWKTLLANYDQDNASSLIISSENFIGIPDELLLYLTEGLDKYKVSIIFIVRHQSSLLPSIYLQWLKLGINYRNFNEYFSAIKNEFDFNKILFRWVAAFGESNIKCDVLSVGKPDSVKVFSELIKNKDLYSILTRDISPQINQNLNPFLLNVLRFLDWSFGWSFQNENFPGWDCLVPNQKGIYPKARIRVVKAIERISSLIPRCGNIIDQKIKENISNYYYCSNQQFHKTYLKEELSEWFKV